MTVMVVVAAQRTHNANILFFYLKTRSEHKTQCGAMLRRFSTLRLLFRPTVLNHARLSRPLPLEEGVPSFLSFIFLSSVHIMSRALSLSLSLSLSLLLSSHPSCPPSLPLPLVLLRWIRSINRNQHRHRDEPSLNHIVQ